MSVDLLMRRTLSGLGPVDALGQDALGQYPLNTVLKVTARRDRSSAFHRKWFALLQVVYPHQTLWPTFDLFRKAIQRACGFFEDVNGQRFDVSIAWAKMDQKTFEELFELTLVLIETKIIPGIARTDVEERYREVLRGYDPLDYGEVA